MSGNLKRIQNQRDLEQAYEFARENNIEQLDLFVCKRLGFILGWEYWTPLLKNMFMTILTLNELRRIYTAHFVQGAM